MLYFRRILSIIMMVTMLSGCVTMPKGTNYKSEVRKVENVEFLYDLTYEKDGKTVREQQIFRRVFEEIDRAEQFIIIDMFLFNDDYSRKYNFPDLANQLTTALVNKKKKTPEVKIYFVTDPVNTFYGAYESKFINRLEAEGIEVIITNLNRLRDSNLSYSIFWRTFIQWFGTSGKGWMTNAFSPDSPDVTLRSYLKLINFKANHRKVAVTDKIAVITSANPHDGSGYHSNIAFVLGGNIIKDFIEAEKAVANFSGGGIDVNYNEIPNKKGNIEITYLTEKKILDSVIEEIKNSKSGDKIDLGMFYFSHRKILKELIKASKRDVNIRIILDANKDAFGREKTGIPNRQVANELKRKSKGNIKIKWYNTKGEQFHTKIIIFNRQNESVVIGGSSNYTRRNLNNFNLESDIMIKTDSNQIFVTKVNNYFERIYNNVNGKYTLDYEAFAENKIIKNIIYRFQEFSGLSTF